MLYEVITDYLPKDQSMSPHSLVQPMPNSFGGESWVEYAEHPYVSGKIGKFSLDIVPCYGIENCEKIISAVDRTPLHNEFLVLSNSKKNLSNDVRLLKKFLKGISVYGSDLKTAGFSGYLRNNFV